MPAAPRQRCFGDGDPLYERYHDTEWGLPVIDEQGLYERLCLEAFQAGLSWRTVLHKRERFRAVFAGFVPEKVARFTPIDVERLMADPGIIRNRAKIEAAIGNARAVLDLHGKGGSLAGLIWSFAPSRPPVYAALADVPAATPASRALSAALRKAGFRFVGPTTAYATMQAAGLVNDHLSACPRHRAVAAARRAALREISGP